jgi:Na+-transporting methylmalonyl-CoA/oxaloacetate decarboxylase gamma subunit
MTVMATTWPDALLGTAGIALVTVVLSVLIWQILATGRTGLSARREKAYQALAEEATRAQRQTAEELERTSAELAQLVARTSELERLLQAVE